MSDLAGFQSQYRSDVGPSALAKFEFHKSEVGYYQSPGRILPELAVQLPSASLPTLPLCQIADSSSVPDCPVPIFNSAKFVSASLPSASVPTFLLCQFAQCQFSIMSNSLVPVCRPCH